MSETRGIVEFLTQDHLAPRHLRRRSHSKCDAVAAREGRIFKRLHHPVDTRYTMAKDNGDGFKHCAKQRIPTRQLCSLDPSRCYADFKN